MNYKIYQLKLIEKVRFARQKSGVYRVFNIARPKGFKGHMLSISDIVELDGALYYVNPFGFVEIDRDFKKIRSLP